MKTIQKLFLKFLRMLEFSKNSMGMNPLKNGKGNLQPILIKVLAMCMALGFFQTANAQTGNLNDETFWPTKEAQLNSQSFKAASGSNRIIYFNELQDLIRTVNLSNENETGTGAVGTHITTRDEVIYLLGDPSNKILMSLYEYNLNTVTSSCKVVIGFDSNDRVNFFTIKDCH